jgi:integrase
LGRASGGPVGVRAFNKARKAGKWRGENPAEAVDRRNVPETVVNILAPEEVLPFFGALELEQRPVFGAAIVTGLRKGELCGLQKPDVDLARRLLTVRRSYAGSPAGWRATGRRRDEARRR